MDQTVLRTARHRRSRLAIHASRVAIVLLLAATATQNLRAQVVHGTVSSTVGAGRVPGAVVLLLDSSLTPQARALTSDSGTFTIGAGAPGRFLLKVMRIGFRPTESPTFVLARDTTIDLALADIPVVLPAITTRDRNDCRLHPDTTAAGLLTFALWDQARTALLAAAITLEEHNYRFAKLLHLRIYDMSEPALRDMALHETESQGTAPWSSLPAERLRDKGYTVEDDSGMTFFAPDLDVLLSQYFTEEHCFRLTNLRPPYPEFVGIDFEPAGRVRHVEIRGTLWLDSASKELRSLGFTFVNLPISSPDTLLGGHLDFARLTTGAWIIPSWSIRMPTPVRPGATNGWVAGFGPRTVVSTRARWRLSADQIRVAGGDVRAVRRPEPDTAVVWKRRTGSVRVLAFTETDGRTTPAPGVIVRLAGSPYGGYSAVDGTVRFDQVLPGNYLFEATTPLHDVVEAVALRTAVSARADTLIESRALLKPLDQAAAEVCDDRSIGHRFGVIAGYLTLGSNKSPVPKVRVSAEWTGGERDATSRADGYYRICGVPLDKLLLLRASADNYMVTKAVTLAPREIVKPLDLVMQP